MASVLVPLAEGCEELEAVTILDLLVRAGIKVVSAGLQEGPVRCSRGTVIVPDMTLDKALEQDYDMLVLPGGLPGADHLDNDPRIKALLVNMANAEKFTAAICAAPKVLASAGLLDHKRATSYPGIIDNMDIDGLSYASDAVVRDGNVITSRGPGTAMDFALQLIELLAGQEKRNEVESGLVRT
jgi:4-methyl-5(b-hydroxyethyl)-thiazole monophosphate biosynthesis